MAERSGIVGEWNDADQLESILPSGHTRQLNKHTAGAALSTVESLLQQCLNINPDMIFVDDSQVTVRIPSGNKGDVIRTELKTVGFRGTIEEETKATIHHLHTQREEEQQRVQKLLF